MTIAQSSWFVGMPFQQSKQWRANVDVGNTLIKLLLQICAMGNHKRDLTPNAQICHITPPPPPKRHIIIVERQTKRKLDHVFFKKCYLPDDFLDVMQQHPIFPNILYHPKLWLLPRPPRVNKHSRFFIHVLTDPLGTLLICHCIIVYLNVSTL